MEGFAGPHDYLSEGFMYNALGNVRNMTVIQGYLANMMSGLALLASVLFVAASVGATPLFNQRDEL